MRIFIIKEFLQIFRDTRSMIILFGIPIVQVLLFGFALKTDMKDVNIAVLDQSKDVYSQELTRKILSSEYFNLSSNLSSSKEIEDEFKKGNIREVLVYGEHFGEDLIKNGRADVQIITDASDPNSANIVYS